ncbi:hypothetical protein PV356_30810 [Streptomyces sp. WI03-5b]|uniref:hypothetical protein n=1 Tax=Streptomyces sp. WI03-5b TaxID=462946 RepID=UPI0029ADE4ED|nr:hypothetical protein [Streptomyces sp. WI03-5b]MDX2623851.1 hypothetical protein [Streptomyces sp. WI03-5b]
MDTTSRPLPTDPQECRQNAEDTDIATAERQVWATLAVAGELHELRKLLRKR